MHRDLDLVMFRMMEDTFNWENDEEFHLLQSYITRFVTINNVCQILGDGAQILTLLLFTADYPDFWGVQGKES